MTLPFPPQIECYPAAEGHGLCPWMNAPAFGRDVAAGA